MDIRMKEEERYCPRCLMELDITEVPRLLYCLTCHDFVKYEKSLDQEAEKLRIEYERKLRI
jgi:hypothetical protein